MVDCIYDQYLYSLILFDYEIRYSWGESGDYKTGLGSEAKQLHPRLVEGFDAPVVRIAIGQSHGVAVTSE